MWKWFKKMIGQDKAEQEEKSAYQKEYDSWPWCWTVTEHGDEDGVLTPPSIDKGKLERKNPELNSCWIHYRWEPKHDYDCGGWISGCSMEGVYTSEEEANAEYARCMVAYANALVNKGFLLLCEYSKDR